jgi:hypothetical protein
MIQGRPGKFNTVVTVPTIKKRRLSFPVSAILVTGLGSLILVMGAEVLAATALVESGSFSS